MLNLFNSKKGDAMETMVILIAVLVSLGIGILFLFLYAPGLQSIICTVINRVVYIGRGIVVDLMWMLYWVVLAILLLIIWVFGSVCKAFPVGTAVCAALTIAIIAGLTMLIFNSFAALPLFECPIPATTLGAKQECSTTTGVSQERFIKDLGEKSLDCWAMFGKGKYNPLTGKTPPNPRDCYIINFNLKTPMTPREMITNMLNNSRNNVTYFVGSGNAIMLDKHIPNWSAWYDVPVKKGRVFIKYGDAETFSKWSSADCNISFGFSPPSRLEYYSFTGTLLDQIKLCADDCKNTKVTPPACINNMAKCDHTCFSVPENCLSSAGLCAARDIRCPASCMEKLGSCSSECLIDMADCVTDDLGDYVTEITDCYLDCSLLPHDWESITNLWALSTAKDYVYWCFDESVTCNSSCKIVYGSNAGLPCDDYWPS